MNGQTLQHTVTITAPRGFHLRPMMAFAQLAGRFKSNVAASCEGRNADGKSILQLMGLAAEQGCEVTIKVDGPDAPAALDALVGMLQNIQSFADEEELTGSTPPAALDS